MTAKPLPGHVRVEAADRIFQELGDTNYEDIDILAELIDNAIAAKVDGVRLKVEIEVAVSASNPDQSSILIRDNASGIAFDKLGDAISPAGTAGPADASLNEHGLGMKQAIAAAGTLAYVRTKTMDMPQAVEVKRFGFGDLPVDWVDVVWDHGTEIKIVGISPDLSHGRRVYSERISSYLGARYRRLLDPEAASLELGIVYRDLDSGERHEFWVAPVRPVYFHPNKRQNRPVVLKKSFIGDGWEAKLTFGYAPEDDAEYEYLNLNPPKKYEPYAKAFKKQGLDVIMHGRVIQFHQLSELGLIKAPHPQYNNVRGELELVKGFSTATTKNRMKRNANWVQLLTDIKEFVDEEELLKGRHVPSEIPEAVLRDRLVELLGKPPYNRKDVKSEIVVEGLEGRIDVLADAEPWEIKKGQAGGLDVYQLLAYMDFAKFKKGVLVADNFTNGAKAAKELIAKHHKKEMELIPRENLAINHPLTKPEIDHYL